MPPVILAALEQLYLLGRPTSSGGYNVGTVILAIIDVRVGVSPTFRQALPASLGVILPPHHALAKTAPSSLEDGTFLSGCTMIMCFHFAFLVDLDGPCFYAVYTALGCTQTAHTAGGDDCEKCSS